MSSWVTGRSARRGSWLRPSPSRCRTSGVSWGTRRGWGRGGTREHQCTKTSFCPAAMSSYLYIVKSEVPLVIQTFLNLEEKTT